VAEEMQRYEELKRQRKSDAVAGAVDSDEEDDDEDDDVQEAVFGSALGKAAAVVDGAAAASAVTSAALKSHVPVPSQEVIKGAILDHRKAQLSKMFLGTD
jgi:hypothetical protein